ncbi:CASP-like protein PIMP1 [Cryptomeria japonica]|uniref:CASP-like protein PIMP1 n=1 Tax=Cryptomeria japonica TaxID=3369 RepID=UPI0027DA1E21|nr:CASP-like protein PIMP1 [Cryptomeria japonica]
MKTSVVQNLILRIVTSVLLLISLIVMLSSKTRSDVLASTGLEYRFNDFKPFRYVVAADVIGCVYSIIGIVLLISGISGGLYFYLTFIFDQVVAYITLSSSSTAIGCIMITSDVLKAAQAYDAAAKKFVRYASASVSLEFLGFVVIACCAVMSGYNLSCYLYSSKTDSGARQGIHVDSRQQGDVRNQFS